MSSLRERLLVTVDSFFLAITTSGEINDTFSVDFGSLLKSLEEAPLSSADAKLAFEVAKTIEELASGLQRLEEVCSDSGRELEGRVEKDLLASDSNDCDAFLPLHSCSQPLSSLSSSPSTTSCSSPSTNSSTTTPSSRKRGKPSLDSPSDLSPTTESSDSNTVFAPLRDWFLEHMAFPFPTKLEKKTLVLQKGLTLNSINLWFTNMRRRSGWTEAQHTFASSNLNKFKSLVEQYNDPSSVPASAPPLTPEFKKEVERLTTYVNDRGNGRVRAFVLKVLQDGIHETKHIPDDALEEYDETSEDDDDESQIHAGGRRKIEEIEDAESPAEEKPSEIGGKKRVKSERGGEGTRTISSLALSEQARRYSFESSSTESSYTGSGPSTPTAYSDHYRKGSFSSDSMERVELDSHSSCGSSSPYPFPSQQPHYPSHLLNSNIRSKQPLTSMHPQSHSQYTSNSPSPVAGRRILDAPSSRRHSSTAVHTYPLDVYHQEDPSRRSSLPWSFRGGRGEEGVAAEIPFDAPRYRHHQQAPPTQFNSRPFVQASSYSSSHYQNTTLFHPSTYQAQSTRPSSSYHPHFAGDPYPSYHHQQHSIFQPPTDLPLQRHRLVLQKESLHHPLPRRSSMSPLATTFNGNGSGAFAKGSRKRRSSALAELEGGAKRARYGGEGRIEEGSEERRVEWTSER